VLVFLLLVGSHAAVAADNGGRLMVQLAPDMIHFDPSPEHTKYSWLVGLEWIRDDDWLAGYSYFNNSFNQKSHYAYGGRVWPLGERNSPHWYFKLTGGLLIGYREQQRHRPRGHSRPRLAARPLQRADGASRGRWNDVHRGLRPVSMMGPARASTLNAERHFGEATGLGRIAHQPIA
jgi:hypothetical protein